MGTFDPADMTVTIKDINVKALVNVETGYTGVDNNNPTIGNIIPRTWDTPAEGCFATYDALIPANDPENGHRRRYAHHRRLADQRPRHGYGGGVEGLREDSGGDFPDGQPGGRARA